MSMKNFLNYQGSQRVILVQVGIGFTSMEEASKALNLEYISKFEIQQVKTK